MAFTPRAKIVSVTVALLTLFLALFLVVLPTVLVNRSEIRAALQQHLGDMLGGRVTFDQIRLMLVPRVCVSVDRPRLDRPDSVSAQALDVEVCLKFLPLLRGRVVPSIIKVQTPDIHLPIASMGPAGSAPDRSSPRRLLKRFAELAKQIPESVIAFTNGQIELHGPSGRRFEFRNLHHRSQHAGRRLEWSLEGESDVFKTFSARGHMDTDSFIGTTTFQVTDLRLQGLQAFFSPDSAFQILDTRMDLKVSLDLEGSERATATIAAKAPQLAFGRNRRQTHLSIDRIDARLELSEKRWAIAISELSARTPRAALELKLIVDEEAHPKIGIDLSGRGDLTGARDFALAMLHEMPETRLVCDILRSGDVPQIHLKLHGDSWDELTNLNNLSLKGRLENGRIHIPWIDLSLNEVSGDALIAGGILEGQGLQASYQETHGENGTLRVGLSSSDPVLQIDIFTRADLSPLPPLLARMVPDPAFRQQVLRIQEISGTAQGTLRLSGTHTDVAVEVRAFELDVKARHQDIPYPLRLQGGEFVYDGDSISLRGVDITLGASKLFKHNLTQALHGDRHTQSNSPKAVIDLSEMFNLFRGQPLFERLNRLNGVLTFNDWQFDGQAFAPDTWKLSANGTVQDLSVGSDLLPGLIRMASGRFDWRGRAIRGESGAVSIHRSHVKGLSFEIDWTESPRVGLRALGLEAELDDISQILQSFPEAAAYAAGFYPVRGLARVQGVRLQARLRPEGLTIDQFEAELKDSVITPVPLGLSLNLTAGSIDWQNSKLELQIAKASFGRSEVQQFSISLDVGVGGALELSADSAYIECGELVPHLLRVPGWRHLQKDVADVRGSLRLSGVDLKGPGRDSDRWRIKAASDLKDLEITTTFLEGPVRVPSGRLTATDIQAGENVAAVFQLNTIRLSHAPHTVTISGEIRLSPSETRLDLNVAAEDLHWGEIEKISDRIAKYQEGESRPVRGRIDIRTESFQYERFRTKPLHALATFDDHGTTVLIERAGFCGMTLIGRISFEESLVDAYLVPVVNALPIDGVMACLTSENQLTSGNFNLDGSIQVRARREELIKALSGRLNLVVEDGTILQSVLFARLFSILNLTEIYRGHFPDFKSQGLDFKRSKATIEIKDGKVVFHDWSIDGRTLWMGSRGEIDIATQKIDFTIMVSPFKTIDRIINAIPGVRWILGGRLVAIPMKATGELENPNIVALSPTAVGTSLLEMFQRTLALPIEIIQPLVPGMGSQEGATITR